MRRNWTRAANPKCHSNPARKNTSDELSSTKSSSIFFWVNNLVNSFFGQII